MRRAAWAVSSRPPSAVSPPRLKNTSAASSVVAFRQTVLRRLPIGSGQACSPVAAHRTEDLVVDAARERTLRAHAAACSDCAPAVEEILALHGALRPRVAGMALGAEGASWLRARPRRSWAPGVERPAAPVDRRRSGTTNVDTFHRLMDDAYTPVDPYMQTPLSTTASDAEYVECAQAMQALFDTQTEDIA